eukprot:1138360-Pelagomonas_calceolata.AAC.1
MVHFAANWATVLYGDHNLESLKSGALDSSMSYRKLHEKKDTAAVTLPHQRIRGKLAWVWWVSGSMRPQGIKVMSSVCACNGTSGRGKFLRLLHRVGMELTCKLGRP